MEIVLLAAAAGLVLLLLGRFWGGRRGAMLREYETLERRYGLRRVVVRSPWGGGVGERYRLEGSFRGYALKLYDHYRGRWPRRKVWTSLTLEAPFAGELELALQRAADDVFGWPEGWRKRGWSLEDRLDLWCSDETFGEASWPDSLLDRLSRLAADAEMGQIRITKGFIEYRERGLLADTACRRRFQTALLCLADLADALSLRAAAKPAEGGEGV